MILFVLIRFSLKINEIEDESQYSSSGFYDFYKNVKIL